MYLQSLCIQQIEPVNEVLRDACNAKDFLGPLHVGSEVFAVGFALELECA